MRNATSTIRMTARECRRRGQASWPIPLEKLDALAEYLRAVDQLVLSAEAWVADYDAWRDQEHLIVIDDDPEYEQIVANMRAALDQVRS